MKYCENCKGKGEIKTIHEGTRYIICCPNCKGKCLHYKKKWCEK